MHVSIDKVRQYRGGRPCNIRHSPAEVGTCQYFNIIKGRLFRAMERLLGWHICITARMLPSTDG